MATAGSGTTLTRDGIIWAVDLLRFSSGMLSLVHLTQASSSSEPDACVFKYEIKKNSLNFCQSTLFLKMKGTRCAFGTSTAMVGSYSSYLLSLFLFREE